MFLSFSPVSLLLDNFSSSRVKLPVSLLDEKGCSTRLRSVLTDLLVPKVLSFSHHFEQF